MGGRRTGWDAKGSTGHPVPDGEQNPRDSLSVPESTQQRTRRPEWWGFTFGQGPCKIRLSGGLTSSDPVPPLFLTRGPRSRKSVRSAALLFDPRVRLVRPSGPSLRFVFTVLDQALNSFKGVDGTPPPSPSSPVNPPPLCPSPSLPLSFVRGDPRRRNVLTDAPVLPSFHPSRSTDPAGSGGSGS